jgi:nitrite reductase (NO-forming)
MSKRTALTFAAFIVLGTLALVLFAPPSSPAVAAGAAGAAVFASNCSSCHGADGQGVPNAFPPLAKNGYVTGDPKKVIHTVVNGLSGAITVNGKTYSGGMPPFKGTLTNTQIAAVITYIRSSWGNKASAVTEKQVASTK